MCVCINNINMILCNINIIINVCINVNNNIINNENNNNIMY